MFTQELIRLQDNYNSLRKTFISEAIASIKDAFLVVFEKYSDCRSIAWVQYTPYFNDGEPCLFVVHDIGFMKSEEVNDYPETNLFSWQERKNFADLEDFAVTLCAMEDVLLDMFGDHCKIVVTRKGINVTEYEHD